MRRGPLLLVAASLAACASAPGPAAGPLEAGAAAGVSHEPCGAAGVGSAAPGRAEDALRVEARFTLLERLPRLLEPLAAHTRLVLREPAHEPLAPCLRLLAGARVGDAPDPAAFVAGLEGSPACGRAVAACGDLVAALPEGVTAHLDLARDAGAARRRLRVSLARRGGGLDVQVALERPDGGAPALERAVLVRRPGERLRLALLLPSPFGGEARAVAVALTVGPPPAAGEAGAASHDAAFAACAGDVARALGAARAVPRPAGAPALSRAALPLDGALNALADEGARRRALLGLASATGSALGVDVALGASDAVLADAARRLAAAPPALEPARVGWEVERACALALAGAAGEEPCPPEVHSLLVRRAGAVGLHPGAVVAAAEAAADLEGWERALRDENVGLLRDGDPTLRARALAWLAARGLAPAGFDPLAPRAEREAALDGAPGEAPGQAPGQAPDGP